MNIIKLINNNKNQFDKKFKNLLKHNLNNSILSKAMFYGSINGGKRIRPFLVSQASKLTNIDKNDSFIIAASIELIHSYSLIHDDLPCMDDDDFRRGKLSTHKKYNEATAILAGDALHDLAFTLLSGNLKSANYKSTLVLINELSTSIGHEGLALGQSFDLEFENKKISKSKILDMYSKKTGKLFEFSFSAPFILSKAKDSEIKFSKEFGLVFGLIFQIIDDLIDEIGTLKKIGKTPGKDKKQGKSTLLGILGRESLIKFCYNKIYNFQNEYKNYLKKNKLLIELLKFGVERIK